MKASLKTPVLLITFRRPETTKKVFEEIRKARPERLFLFSDGPRNEEEKVKVEMVRKIISNIDWPCKVKKLFMKKNLGLAKGALGSVHWFFKNVEEGIIFDDDCVPDQSFFRFCSELLEKYRDDDRVMHITGSNPHRVWKRDSYSYYFSKYPYVWGWATWRRAWKKYDFNMDSYPDLKRKKYFSDIFKDRLERKYILGILDHAYYKNPNAVDTRWLFSIIVNNGISIVPSKNLVRNIGFGDDSTHTKVIDSFLSIPSEKMEFPLKHPKFLIKDEIADKKYVRWLFKNRLKKKILVTTGLYKFFKV